ncbi:MAG: 2-C-methyl-D-erythritol 4-phosphate cytidylyltransferase [Halieaceae bacterium]|jgi:2-C-methyl-D-erythritol 4-phosphate cytidylyltransferase
MQSANSGRYFCVIPAAGVGRRFGSSLAKQHQKLSAATVLEVTTSRLLELQLFERIVLVLAANEGDKIGPVLAANPAVVTATGGAQRSESVLAGLKRLDDIAKDNDWVMVHDAARPCFKADDVRRLAAETSDSDCGGLLAVPVSDTLRVVEGDKVIGTVDRATIWRAQTPQCYRYRELYDAVSGALAAGVAITDETSAVEWSGGSSLIVEGSDSNIKITHAEDLPLAEYYLRSEGYWD